MPPQVEKMYGVPLVFQLLLENAIKHNHATSAKPLTIKISAEKPSFNHRKQPAAAEVLKNCEAIGLSNIVQHYALLTTQQVSLQQTNNHFKFLIPILTKKILS